MYKEAFQRGFNKAAQDFMEELAAHNKKHPRKPTGKQGVNVYDVLKKKKKPTRELPAPNAKIPGIENDMLFRNGKIA